MSLDTLFYIICIILLIINFMYYKSTKHPFKYAFVGGVSGMVFLIPAVFALQYFGIQLAINYSTLILSALLGIPGVILTGIYTIFF